MTASEDGRPVTYYDGVTISPDLCVDDIGRTDLVFVPTIGMDIDGVLSQTTRMLRFLRKQAERGGVVAAVCTGGAKSVTRASRIFAGCSSVTRARRPPNTVSDSAIEVRRRQ